MDFLDDELEDILNVFREESEEHIQKINQNLLRLESNPDDLSAVSELFREAHSIKGASRMVGLNDIQAIAHKIEDLFGLARDGQLKFEPQIIDKLCHSVDFISSIVEESIKTKGLYHSEKTETIISELEEIVKKVKSGKYAEACANRILPTVKPLTEAEKQFYIKYSAILPEIKNSIYKLKDFSTDTECVKILYSMMENLENDSEVISNFKTKETISDIKLKLQSVLKGSGILMQDEINEIRENYSRLNKKFSDMLLRIENDSKIQQKTIIIDEHTGIAMSSEIGFAKEPAGSGNIDKELDFITNNFFSLCETSPEALANVEKIISKLSNIRLYITNNDIKNIFSEILNLTQFINGNKAKPTKEIVEVLFESLNTAILLNSFPSENINDDPVLILQRLKILYQMIKISEQDLPFQPHESGITGSESYSPAPVTTLTINTEEKNQKEEETKESAGTTIKTLRVDTKKLDQLVSQVGELIIAKIKAKDHLLELEKIISSFEDWYRELNKMKQVSKYMDKKPIKSCDLPGGTSLYYSNKNIFNFFEDGTSKISDMMTKMNTLYRTIQEDDTRLNLIVNDLEEKIKNIRVLPLATIFHMFPRMVRDIAREKNKTIDLIISGSETSVDKKIIEEIKSPLIHIMRNSIDHGIETPEERINNGKNPVGKIVLSAHHLENSVLIEIEDDGKGINIESIKRKVLQKKLISSTELQTMTEDQIMNIIFWPGFSTGEVVTDISGRGIGLDIVHTKISQLNGKVSIKSIPNRGCKVSIQLPVTMATIKSFLVEVNSQTFAIPTSSIKTAILINPKEIFKKEGRETILVDNTTIPVCKLSHVLELNDDKPLEEKTIVIVIKAEDTQVGFIVDKLLGDQEILHKNLSAPLLRVRNVAGVTTLGSGELCLILNINDLVKSAFSIFGMFQKNFIYKQEIISNKKNKNILVVDDSVTTRILERNILRTAGYSVSIAVNGLDALTKLASEQFDLIVSDIEMPEINGFELTERVKNTEEYSHIPIILVSSLASEVDKKKGLSLGASAYIQKGAFDQNELLYKIDNILSNKE